MLICKFASENSSSEKIHGWIEYLEELDRKHADGEARRLVAQLLEEARGWTAPPSPALAGSMREGI